MVKKRRLTFFISSRWRNRDTVLDLVAKIRAKGYRVLSFFENPYNKDLVNDDPEKVMKEWEAMSNWEQNILVKKIFEEDIRSIRKADAVILFLPAGISAHIEIGYAFGLGKKCILIGKPEKTESAYMIFEEKYLTIDEFIRTL